MRVVREIVIRNPQGLHARPAALFVQIASKYNANITVQKDKEKVNGRSIMGILTLGAQQNSKIILEANGNDAEAAITELESLLTRQEIL